jgi:hypothetical protein
MRFAFIPKAQYKIGQIIQVQGRAMRVESLGRNVIACALDNGQHIACICTDAPAIEGVTA